MSPTSLRASPRLSWALADLGKYLNYEGADGKQTLSVVINAKTGEVKNVSRPGSEGLQAGILNSAIQR